MAVGAAKKSPGKPDSAKSDQKKTPEAKSKTSGVSLAGAKVHNGPKRLPVEEEVKQREEKAALAKNLLMTITKPILEENGYIRAIGDPVRRPSNSVVIGSKPQAKPPTR